MSIGSYFLWTYYWAFRNFITLDDDTHKSYRWFKAILFSLCIKFTYFILMKYFEERARYAGFKMTLPKVILAIFFLGLSMMGFFQGQLSQMYIAWDIGAQVISVYILFQTQRMIAELNQRLEPERELENKLAIWEYFLIVIGLSMYFYTIRQYWGPK